MGDDRWPALTIYDFLGYFIPGALALYLFLLVLGRSPGSSRAIPELSWEEGVLYFLLAYVAGHLLSLLSSLLIETYAIRLHGYPSDYLFRKSRARKENLLLRVLLRLAILPIALPHWIVGARLGLSRKFTRSCDAKVAEKILTAIQAYTRFETLEDVEFFHLISHWVREHAPGHAPTLQSHVARKGFLRTLTLLAVIATWVALAVYGASQSVQDLLLALSCAGAAYLAFLSYLKQERRYTLETLLAFCVAYDEGTGGPLQPSSP